MLSDDSRREDPRVLSTGGATAIARGPPSLPRSGRPDLQPWATNRLPTLVGSLLDDAETEIRSRTDPGLVKP